MGDRVQYGAQSWRVSGASSVPPSPNHAQTPGREVNRPAALEVSTPRSTVRGSFMRLFSSSGAQNSEGGGGTSGPRRAGQFSGFGAGAQMPATSRPPGGPPGVAGGPTSAAGSADPTRRQAQTAEAADADPAGDDQLMELTTTEIASDVFLQQILYYDVYFCIAWFIAMCVIMGHRFRYELPLRPPDLWGGVIIPWALIQPLRLHVGHAGNLRERVEVLLAFVLMTFFLSNIMNIYFIFLMPRRRYPVEKAIACCGIGMNMLSCFAAGRAAVRIGRAQARQFYLADYEDLRQRIERAAEKMSTIQDLRSTLATEEEQRREQDEQRRRDQEALEEWRRRAAAGAAGPAAGAGAGAAGGRAAR